MELKLKGVIQEKSYVFAIKIVRVYQHLSDNKREFVLSKQLLRSGTAIGALSREAEHAQSKADFVNKLSVALKEANETSYWLSILKDTEYLTIEQYNSLIADSQELIRMLVSSIKTLKSTV